MMMDRILAVFAVALVVGFLSFLVIWVPRTDLVVCISIVVMLMSYDFYRELRAKSRARRAADTPKA